MAEQQPMDAIMFQTVFLKAQNILKCKNHLQAEAGGV